MITIELGRTALVALLLVSCFLAMSVQGRQEKGRQRATAEAGFEKRPDRRNLQRYRGDAYTYGRFPTDPGYQRYRRRGSKGRYASKKSSKTKTRRNSSGKSGSKGKKEGYRLDYKKGKSTAKDYGYYDDYYLADDAYPGVPLDDFYLPDDELYYTPLEYYTFVEVS